MLARLSIRDIVLIDRLDIDFGSGLATLTGETGAGKSILLDAFALALGARGDTAMVREGAEQGQVIAAFDLAQNHPARRLLAENDLGGEDELIMRRVQFADGRTRAFVNDQPVSVQVLRALGAALVEIHGQHDERAFVDAATHRALLDAYGGIEGDAVTVARLWDERRAREDAVAHHRAEVERRGGMAAPRGRRARPPRARNRRGDGARRTACRHDAGRKGRRGFALDP
jgi:DNA repair protein RecN (Recombination protein N)